MTEKTKVGYRGDMNYEDLYEQELDEWQKKMVLLYAERLHDKGAIENFIAKGGSSFFGISSASLFFQYVAEIIPDQENPAFIEALDLMEPICRIKTAFELIDSRKPAPDSARVPTNKRPSGFIYIAKSEGNPGMLKIGMTTKSIAVRIKQLSNSTTSVHPFVLVEGFPSIDPMTTERLIHSALDAYRVHGGREFFAVTEAKAIEVCKQVIGGAV